MSERGSGDGGDAPHPAEDDQPREHGDSEADAPRQPRQVATTLEVTVAEIVFACNELNAKGKQMMRMIANHTPSHLQFLAAWNTRARRGSCPGLEL